MHSYSATIQPVQRALGSDKETSRNYFSAALANPEFFNAMVAMGSAAYEARMSRAYVKTQSARVLYFRGQALKLLWQKLERGDAAIDVGTVMAIILLMGMDVRTLNHRWIATSKLNYHARLHTVKQVLS
jgi:hypothetical protein